MSLGHGERLGPGGADLGESGGGDQGGGKQESAHETGSGREESRRVLKASGRGSSSLSRSWLLRLLPAERKAGR